MNVADVLPANWTSFFSPTGLRIGIGVDPATTTKKKSNPTGISVLQQDGVMIWARLVLRFKTDDDRVTTALIRAIATGLPHGLKARKVCILATNERFYAGQLRRSLAGIVPVEAVIESEATQYLGEKMSIKAYLGNQLINTLEDGYSGIPDEAWLKADIRQVVRTAGTFDAEVDENGNHADAFCALGAGLHALRGRGGRAVASATPVGSLSKPTSSQGWKNPNFQKFQRGGSKIHV